ncbi:Hypothetical protein SMAX5B_012157 [Scophthalmus maximus]|uniref:Uncharacterized protein n=1 Tax=Scophthalmus maximus TaxID=52904 RepID=A0A2U9AYZ7_SCOMX|nr:Hypothetical protein SMAX5B_012157 [Scophthalmus maximus]
MVSAKQPSRLWQIGRPSGPISLALISVHILTSARDVKGLGAVFSDRIAVLAWI